MKTKIIKITEENRTSAIEMAAKELKNGAIVAFPTDTVYGLGAVYSDEKAVRKIFAAKGRDEKKPLSILIDDIGQVDDLASYVPDDALTLMKKFWPGALTVILNKKDDIPDEVTAGKDTIGIRMPASDIARELIRAAGSPIAAPSANLSGKRSAAKAEEVIEDLSERIDIILDGGACDQGISSTVVDMTGTGVKVLREGNITKDIIDEALGNK